MGFGSAVLILILSLSARRAWIEIYRKMLFEGRKRQSLSARRAWIEMLFLACWCVCEMSLSARRAWIEIVLDMENRSRRVSLSARRAWIEITVQALYDGWRYVALRKESVDRNIYYKVYKPSGALVALRKESVDRNSLICLSFSLNCSSLSARRAWIEIVLRPDRRVHGFGRSPQGERG